MFKVHSLSKGKVAELLPGKVLPSVEEILEIMAEAGYQDCSGLIIHSSDLPEGFFELRTGIAGEILQKFSNYRMKLAIVGDFSNVQSKSLNDFIRESNKMGTVSFVACTESAFLKLDK